MLEEQQGGHPRNVSINAPDGSRNGVSDDTALLGSRSLGDLKEEEYLCKWIDHAIGRRSCIPWGTESLPPPKILEHPDLLEKYWGFERLIAYDIYCDVDDISRYRSYLEKFYALNNDCQSKADDLIREFLEKEKALTRLLETRNITYEFYDECLLEYLSGLLNNPEKKRYPFIAYTAAYLVKEAKLLIEWQKRGYDLSSLQFNLISEIQCVIVDFAMLKGAFRSEHAAAVLLGMTKEVAEWLKDAYKDCFDPTKISIYILGYASDFLTYELCEFKYEDSELTAELSDDVASTVEVHQVKGVEEA